MRSYRQNANFAKRVEIIHRFRRFAQIFRERAEGKRKEEETLDSIGPLSFLLSPLHVSPS